jgi:predicted nucleic acid-binding protein
LKLYVDASVLLRIVLRERGALREWKDSTRLVSSELIRLECLRTLDRARIREGIGDEAVAEQRGGLLEALRSLDLLPIDRDVLERAFGPFPTTSGTLDPVHLASALIVRGEMPDLVLATHDRELAVAGRAVGFRVVGVARRARSGG